jgi:hypothetical protein
MLFLLWACGSADKNGKADKPVPEQISPRGDTSLSEGWVKLETERSLGSERALARSKMDRYLADSPEPMQLLAGRTFAVDYRIVVSQKGTNKRIENESISFGQDFNFRWNRSDTLYQQGRYFYSMETDQLLLLSKDEADFPSEWMLKSAGDIVILVGTSTFRNNNTQMRLVLKQDD